jgi:uncharacterized protein DUF4166
MPRNLYQTILGNEFERLPTKIREMHTLARRATGNAKVTRGHSWAAKLICNLANLPEARNDVSVDTMFEPIDGGERWTRKFDGQPFQTDMIAGTEEPFPCMLERLGPFLFKMRVTLKPDGLDLTPESVFLGPVRVPDFLAPKAVGKERVSDGHYSFSVEVTFPFIGKIFGYDGIIQPSEFVEDHELA